MEGAGPSFPLTTLSPSSAPLYTLSSGWDSAGGSVHSDTNTAIYETIMNKNPEKFIINMIALITHLSPSVPKHGRTPNEKRERVSN